MVVKALKDGEVVDVMQVYGMAVNYEKQIGWMYKLTENFTVHETFIEEFGKFPLVDAVNIIIEKVTRQ